MDKFIKVQSNTSSPFTSSQNLIDFSIPSDVYDFSSSYVNLVCRVGDFTLQTTENPNGSGSAITDKTNSLTPIVSVNPVWSSSGGRSTRFDNCSLVKNVRLDSAKKGRIEDIRRADVLFTNLKRFSKPQQADTDHGELDWAQAGERVGSWKWGLSTELEKLGSTMSKQRSEWDVKIPLKDFLGIGGAKEIDVSKTGDMRLNMELNIAKIASMSQFQSSTTDTGSADVYKADNIANGVATITQLTIKDNAEFCDLRDSPYYVGQPIIVTATGGGGASNILSHSVITAIEFDTFSTTSDGGSAAKRNFVRITLAESIGSTSTASHVYTSVLIAPRLFTTAGAPSIEFSDAQLVLARVGAPQGADQVNYFSYSTEEGNGNSLTAFNKQFQLERECVSSMLLFPDETDSLNSHNANLTSYRTRTDNEDNTDRQVTFGKPLEDKCLGDGLMNMGLRYKDYRKIQLSSDQKTHATSKSTGKSITAIVDSHPPTQSEKLYQVNIEASSTGVQSFALFKQLPKQLVY
tara:strand:- start:173 stop:1729 length:1557 start_codon:yes stop_codon:yes gene_type:complete